MKIRFRSLILATLLLSFAGCASLNDFINWVNGTPSSGTNGGCSFAGPGGCTGPFGPSGGCRRTLGISESSFAPIGYQSTISDKPSARDMGIAQSLPEYRLINDSNRND